MLSFQIWMLFCTTSVDLCSKCCITEVSLPQVTHAISHSHMYCHENGKECEDIACFTVMMFAILHICAITLVWLPSRVAIIVQCMLQVDSCNLCAHNYLDLQENTDLSHKVFVQYLVLQVIFTFGSSGLHTQPWGSLPKARWGSVTPG